MYSLLFNKGDEQYTYSNPILNDFDVVEDIVNSRGKNAIENEQIAKLFSYYDGGRLKVLFTDDSVQNLVVRDISLGYEIQLECFSDWIIKDINKRKEARNIAQEAIKKYIEEPSSSFGSFVRVPCNGNKQEVLAIAKSIISDLQVTAFCRLLQYNIGDGYKSIVGSFPEVYRASRIIIKNDIFHCGVTFHEQFKCPENIFQILEGLNAYNISLFYDDGRTRKYIFDKQEIEADFSMRLYKEIGYVRKKPIWVYIFVDNNDPAFLKKPEYTDYKIFQIPSTGFDFSGDDLSLDPRMW